MSGPTPPWAPIMLAVGANGVILTLMAVGAMRRDTLPRSLACTFIGLFVLCAGAFVAALLMPAHDGLPSGVSVSAIALVASLLVFVVVSWFTSRSAPGSIDPDIRLVINA